MKPFTRATIQLPPSLPAFRLLAATVIGLLTGACAASQDASPRPESLVVITDHAQHPRPPFDLPPSDVELLDEIQRASFRLFWDAVSPETGMVYDRTSSDVVSVAGVGFQLAALPVGVERGWITQTEGRRRALQILRALEDEPSNRKAGLFYHFLEPHDASPRRVGAELVVSTIDSAVLFSGMLCAGMYFEGEVRQIADRLFANADWTFFLQDPGAEAPPGEFVSLGWRPADDTDPTGPGALIPYSWIDSGDEHRLVTFMGVAAPNPEHRLPPQTYFSLRRQLGVHERVGEMVWFPYSGALFTAFFAHCFIDYAHMGVDNPGELTDLPRSPVDWWENSRRIVQLHRARARENPEGLPTLGEHAWGLTACDGPDGYLVPGVYPERLDPPGLVSGRDFSTYRPTPRWGGGTVAPYGAGASVMFDPEHAIAALRFYRGLTRADGTPLVWRDPAAGGYGLADSFNLGAPGEGPWVADDDVAIDHGPMLLGIENARSGLVWTLYSSHPAVRAGEDRLGLR
ncbi:MAG: glucoamylase family protein [Phycisphaerales bacterium JB059]